MDSVKVELYNDGDFIGIRTYDRKHGARGRFSIARRVMIIALLEPEQKVTLDTDCGCLAELWRVGHDLWIRFTWLSESSGRQVWGFKQYIKIPQKRLKQILLKTGRIKYLYQTERLNTKIITTNANATISSLLEDKHKRRALSKAMRDCFKWPNEVVTLFNDMGYGFYFTTKSGCPKNGGLILHEGERCDGHHYFRFEVHT